MSHGMYISAEGARTQSQRLEVIANNLANVDTVGFKPDTSIFQARFNEAIQLGTVPPGSKGLPDLGGGVKTIETITNFAAGQLQETGNQTDLAIIGDGFLMVEGPDGGEPLLTRAGALDRDALGRLVLAGTDQAVLSSDGAPIALDPTLPWSVTRDGYVEQAGAYTPLALVEPESLSDLTKVGGNQFRSRSGVAPIEPNRREVRQGFLEMSGANATQQMMQMIETNRAVEANTQMIRHQDSATGNLIGRLLGS